MFDFEISQVGGREFYFKIRERINDPIYTSKLSSRVWEKKQINTLACVSMVKKSYKKILTSIRNRCG